MADPAPRRFRDTDLTLAGVAGETIEFASADPRNYYDVLNRPAGDLAARTIDGKLFLPPGASGTNRVPAVIVVPGSLGVAPSHLAHAATFVGLGLAAFVIDPFGARSVSSTVANQAQFSFAASAYDVLAAVQALNHVAAVDPTRIGAQGHSRGGSAVLTAAVELFADAALGDATPRLAAVYAAYPWCGHQFAHPGVGRTRVRAIIGELDEWCSAQQTQAYLHALQLGGADASFRLVAGAHHSFDRGTEREVVADASVTPSAPTIYVTDEGAMTHPVTGDASAGFTDRDLMIYAIKAGYGRKGATIGSLPGEAELFQDDMVTFWREALSTAR